ncbi:MAG TPA: AraC family transcriptional regulator, partial [Polyangia bacterium]
MTKTINAGSSVTSLVTGANVIPWPAMYGAATTPEPATPVRNTEEVALQRSRSLPGVELWSIRNTTRLWTVLNSRYTFGVAERMTGSLHWRCAGRTGPMTLASTVLGEPNELQVATRIDGPVDLDFLLIDPAVLQREFDRDLGDDDRRHRFANARLEDPGLVGQFRRLWRAVLDPHAEAVEQQSLLRAYLHAVFDQAGLRPAPPLTTRCEHALERIRTVINERHHERLTLDGFAAETSFSKFYLERSFHERFGLPIHQYLKKVRVARAMDLLREGQRPSVVAKKVGFADQPHMT